MLLWKKTHKMLKQQSLVICWTGNVLLGCVISTETLSAWLMFCHLAACLVLAETPVLFALQAGKDRPAACSPV